MQYTIWQVTFGVLIFVKSQRKPSELIFVVLNFVTANLIKGRGAGAANDKRTIHDLDLTWYDLARFLCHHVAL